MEDKAELAPVGLQRGGAWAGPEADAAGLLAMIGALRGEARAAAGLRMQAWLPKLQRSGFGDSAANMGEWLALRQSDLTPLQEPLSALGLSTLGRLEAHVDASLAAVMAALARIAGQPGLEFPEPGRFAAGSALLEARRDALFGDQRPGAPQTRIMVTLPTEAAEDGGALVRALVAEGVDCFRINCAHDGADIWDQMIAHVRAEAARSGRRLPCRWILPGRNSASPTWWPARRRPATSTCSRPATVLRC